MFPVRVKVTRMEPIDDAVLLGILEGKSLMELAEEVNRSFSGVRYRMQALEEIGYLEYPKSRARGRKLTPKALEYLRANGLLKGG